MVERRQLEEGFRALGLTSGDAVEVHSSLSRFGRIAGGAAAVIEALIAVVGPEGTIVMSAYPMSRGRPLTDADRALGIRYKSEVLPEDSPERTTLGAVVDAFKVRPDVVCGTGQHQTCAWGRDARRHTAGYEPLVQSGGRVLLLGVGIGSCSCMHIPEATVDLPAEIKALSALPADLLRAYPEERWYVESSLVPGPPRNAWNVVWDEAVAAGLVRTGTIGKSVCHLFRASEVVGIFERHLRVDPWTLYGVPRPVR